jgi:hypothetical protein
LGEERCGREGGGRAGAEEAAAVEHAGSMSPDFKTPSFDDSDAREPFGKAEAERGGTTGFDREIARKGRDI